MITRDIYRDFYLAPEGPTLEEKIFLVAKRACFGFAGFALVLCALDIAGIHSLNNAKDFLSASRGKVLAFGDTVRDGVRDISIFNDGSSVRVKIPSAPSPKPIAKTEFRSEAFRSEPKPSKPNASIDTLAAVSRQDAMAVAMAQPPAPRAALAPPLRKLETVAASADLAKISMASAPAEAELAPKLSLAALTPHSLTVPGRPLTPPVSLSMDAPIPLAMVPLPIPAPGLPPPSPAERLGLLGADKEKDYSKALRCLANAIYFEARSEPVRGQMAVAQVVINRAFSGFYPNDICAVVYQNAHRRLACQFTFACDGKSKAINERGHWSRANRIARQTLDGQIYVPEVAKSTHYHAAYVSPNWVREMRRLARYGLHSFYRPIAWGNGAENPVWGSTAAMAKASVKTSQR